MKIYDIAMKMEMEGEEYYIALAEKCSHYGVRMVFLSMANDERKHYKIIREMSDYDGNLEESKVLTHVKSVFSEIKNSIDSFALPKGVVEAYQHAVELEKASIEFYQEYSCKTNEDCERKVFDQLIKEEETHLRVLENLIELVKRPGEWVESAEFGSLIEY